MRLGMAPFLAALLLFSGLSFPQRLAAQQVSSRIVSFDAPGAIPVGDSFDGTYPCSINDEGTIAGIYVDANSLYHAFLRSPGGKFVVFDAPGTGASVGTRLRPFPITAANISSHSININDQGAIAGNYVDSNDVSHGFVRKPGGELDSFDAPGADTRSGGFRGTFPSGINRGGTITGHFVDSKDTNLNWSRGFLRSPQGGLTTFDVPGSSFTTTLGFGTFPVSINDDGTITGHYIDAKGLLHGFLRTPEGEFLTVDAPGVSSIAASGYGTFPESINQAGAVTGHYTDAHNMTRGFVRTRSAEFATFDAPDAGTVAAFGFGTFPTSINRAGAIAGHYMDASGAIRGFVRSSSGKLTTFEAPDPRGGGIFPQSINDAGAVTGHYMDARGLNHGFLRTP